ncbi:MAG: cyclophilin type peptidyl-prolyl cis-trans isomerase [Chthonomonadales bacterium]|nr:cyclophilin type peptidyl-prolyl cis-trans isomerase [Chthonomonadales bacterium]
MKIGLYLAALALLVPVIGVSAQEKTPAVLKNPAALKEKAPAKYKAQFETTQGTFVVDVTRAWSPNGADRFYNLVKNGFFDHVKFFRVVPNFVVQFGIHGDPAIATKWLESNIPDDSKVIQGNKKGFLTFAKSQSPNSRSTQLFISLKDNDFLDPMGFSAFGKVSKGMDVVEKLYGGYGESLTQLQGEIAQGGNKYLEKNFPKLDSIKKATLLK